ncbi:MAG: PAS domain S-box protein [Magnetococcales bacterium]|nr:PAS domain S-box protein [Magnetococcales bacterium]
MKDRWMSVASVLLMALGLGVMLAWHLRLETILALYPSFVAMQYNTALCFAVSGLGLGWMTSQSRRRGAFLGMFLLLFAGLTLIQYPTGWNLGLDRLFLDPYLQAHITHPGRMAPNTALAFMLAGGAFLTPLCPVKCPRSLLTAVVGSLIFAMSAVALSGYGVGHALAFGWAMLTPMAIHTALGFLLLAGALIHWAWGRAVVEQGTPPRLPDWLPLLVVVGVLTFTAMQWMGVLHLLSMGEMADGLMSQGHAVSQGLILIFGALFSVALGLSAHWMMAARRRAVAAEQAIAALARETLRREALHSQLQEQQQLLQDILDNTHALVFVKDLEGRYRFVNRRVEEGLGLNRAAILGQTDRELFPQEVAAQFRADDLRTLESGSIELEERLRLADGEHVLLTLKFLLRHPSGEAWGVCGMATDITARKKAEEALWESEARYAHLFRHLGEAAFLAEVETGIILEVNHQAEVLMVASREQLVGRSSTTLHPPEQAERYRQAFIQHAMACGLTGEYEVLPLNGDGTPIPVIIRSSVMTLGGKRVMLGLFQDIREQKRAEEAQRRSEVRYRELIENMSSGVAVYATDDGGESFRIKEINQSVERIENVRREDLLGRNVVEVFPGIESFGLLEVFRRVWRTGQPEHFPLCFYEDQRIQGWRQNYVYRLDSGEVASVYDDLTASKRLEEENRLNEEKVRALLASVDVGIFGTDENGLCLFCNPASVALLGYEREDQLLGRPMHTALYGPSYEWIHGTEYACPLCHAGKCQRTVHNDKVRFLRADGSWMPVEMTCSPLNIGERWGGWVVSFADISERVKLSQQLLQAQKMEAIATLTGGIAHDFNNILTVILGYADLGLSNAIEGSALRRYLEEVFKASIRARDLVAQLLTFSRGMQGESDAAVPIPLTPLVKEVAKFARATLPATIELTVDLPAEELTVFAAPVQIQQILMNLVTNAHHAMERQGGMLTLRVVRRVLPGGAPRSGGAVARLEVRDTGEGIPAEWMERIFEPFFTTKDPGKGTGLGLAVVHGIVQKLGGTLRVESQPGQGALFQIDLPLREEMRQTVELPTLPPELGHERILLVDDEEGILRAVHLGLEKLGYRVISFTDSQAAWDHFAAAPQAFDVAVVDFAMPRLNGAKLGEGLNRLRPDMPVLLCSGMVHALAPEDMGRFRPATVLQKPFLIADLAREIRKLSPLNAAPGLEEASGDSATG